MLQLKDHVPLADEEVRSPVLDGKIGVSDDGVGEGLETGIVEL